VSKEARRPLRDQPKLLKLQSLEGGNADILAITQGNYHPIGMQDLFTSTRSRPE